MQAFFDEHLGMVVNVVSPVLAEQADKISQKKFSQKYLMEEIFAWLCCCFVLVC
jgi:hypothetical protein